MKTILLVLLLGAWTGVVTGCAAANDAFKPQPISNWPFPGPVTEAYKAADQFARDTQSNYFDVHCVDGKKPHEYFCSSNNGLRFQHVPYTYAGTVKARN